MKRTLLLLFFVIGCILAYNPKDDVEILVIPKIQTVKEHQDVVIDCLDKRHDKVRWKRPKGWPLPKQHEKINGRLIIKNIRFDDMGYYTCVSADNKRKGSAYVEVIPRTTVTVPTSTTSLPTTHGFPSTSNPFFPSTTAPPVSSTMDDFFDCANGQKINKTLVCNRVNDCQDGSDESRCEPWPPKITELPKHRVEVFCGDQDAGSSGTLTLECQSVGYPTPVVRWKKYDGHVPYKCQQFSKRGRGVLTCANFQQSDQGAYSCVAENSVKSAESQPKSIAKCQNKINCKGFKVINEDQIEHCVDCYCSGKTSVCQSIGSSATAIKIPFPQSQTEIFAKEDGEVLFVPTKNSSSPDSKVRASSLEITYCSLSEADFSEKSFVKSFGRNVIFPRHKGKTDFLEKAPDLIITGNGLSLMYTANLLSPRGGDIMNVAARFWPGNWHHLNKTTANRQDLMRVLSNLDALLIRCEYKQGETLSLGKDATVIIESSTITGSSNSTSYVEKCSCPAGYDGLSCESCAEGYKHKPQGSGFICEKIYVPPCKEGYIGVNCTSCDTAKGYRKNGNVCVKNVCHPEGSISEFPNIFNKCSCREGVTGDFCDRCEAGSFYLHKAQGCLKCWCSGVTKECNSSSLYRTLILNIPRGGYNSSDGRNFWLLPPECSGNRLTSYGGHLTYTMKYKPGVPKQSTYLTVEILSMGDITLVYTHPTLDTSSINDEKSWTVPLTELGWKKTDKSTVTRGEFLTVLSKVKAIYIESPYHLSSGIANLTSVRMSSASSSGNGDNVLAREVEQCNCPRGYSGLSCESCSEGYYKKRNGTITQCIKCNCQNCDPDFGCSECPELTYRDNPEEEKIPDCKPCPCNGHGVSCEKDDHNQVFCRCQPGYTGMHCENVLPEKRKDFTMTISPRRVSGEIAGTVFSFNCSLLSSEEMKLSVMKTYLKGTYNDTHDIISSGSNVSETIPVTLQVGLQSVECLAYDSDGQMAGHIKAVVNNIITAIKPVKITNCYSNRIDVKESESRDIICEATGSPPPIITWYKKKEGTETVAVDTSEGVHTIESASLSDNGTVYTCIAENTEGDKATCPVVLFVRKKCEVVNISPRDVRMYEGENATLQCSTSARSLVAWHQFDTFFRREKTIGSPRIQVQQGTLRIINATVGDSGTYICTANGENGKINQTADVTVIEKRVPPTVSIPDYDKTIKEGESVDIHCIATGKPQPTVTWSKLKDNMELNVNAYGKTLTIRKATVKNSGVYVCEARSVAGDASSYISVTVEAVTIPPRVNISQESIVAHKGDNVSLTCLSIGYPRPKLNWFVVGAPLRFLDSKIENDNMVLFEPQESVKEEKTFIVTDEMNGATVTCAATNTAGRDEKKAVIKVLQQSEKTVNETVEFVQIGSHYEIECDLAGVLDWKKSNDRLEGDECKIPRALMIPSVQIQHNGTYECTDESGSKKIIHLIVVGFVPKFSKNSRSYLVLPTLLKSPSEIRLDLSFNAVHENGVLLQEETGKLEIYLNKGNVHVSLSLGKEDLLDTVVNEPIALGKWYSLSLNINKNSVEIAIYNEKTLLHGRRSEHSKDFNIDLGFENFFLGGSVPKGRHMARRHFLRRHYLDGCISRLSINRHEFDLVKEGSYSHNVTLCRKCSETQNLCGGNGKCLDAPTQYGFICLCSNFQNDKGQTCAHSCEGRGCDTQLDLCTLLNPCRANYHECRNNVRSLQCECAYGYSGTTCERAEEYSFCAKGNGHVKLPSMLLQRHLGAPEVIRMAFTLEEPNGQLLWQGDKANHLSISVHNGNLRYVYLNQRSKLEIDTGKKIEAERNYIIEVRRLNNTAELTVNLKRQSRSTPEIFKGSTSGYYTNRVVGDIYLGNVPSGSNHAGHHVGLNGCISYVSFGEDGKINLPEKQLERVNVSRGRKEHVDSNSDESEDYNDGDSEQDSNTENYP